MKRIALFGLALAVCLHAQSPAPAKKGPPASRPVQPQSPYPDQARSVVMSRGGIVATLQTLASQAGAMPVLPDEVRSGIAAAIENATSGG